MIGKLIYGRLNGATTAGSRITPLLLRQASDMPAVTYQLISSVSAHAFGQDGNVKAQRVQVDSWAESYEDVRTLADEVEGRLSRFRGTVNGITVQDIVISNETEFYEDDTETFRVSQDYMMYVED